MTIIKPLQSDEEDKQRTYVGQWRLRGHCFWTFAEHDETPDQEADPEYAAWRRRFEPRQMTIWLVNEQDGFKWLTATITVESARITAWQFDPDVTGSYTSHWRADVVADFTALLASPDWQQAMRANFLGVFLPRQYEIFNRR